MVTVLFGGCLVLSCTFANAMIEGLYNIEQFVHKNDHKLIASKRLQLIFGIYATVTDFNKTKHPFLQKMYLSLKKRCSLPSCTHRGALLGAVMFEEVSYDKAVSMYPGLHVHEKASQILHVVWRRRLPEPIFVRSVQRFDRWFPLHRDTVKCLMDAVCGM